MHLLFLVVVLVVSLLALLLPLTGNFGTPTALFTTTFVLSGVISAFLIGRRFGERAH
jgi:CDP-diglyceride synthetase